MNSAYYGLQSDIVSVRNIENVTYITCEPFLLLCNFHQNQLYLCGFFFFLFKKLYWKMSNIIEYEVN